MTEPEIWLDIARHHEDPVEQSRLVEMLEREASAATASIVTVSVFRSRVNVVARIAHRSRDVRDEARIHIEELAERLFPGRFVDVEIR